MLAGMRYFYAKRESAAENTLMKKHVDSAGHIESELTFFISESILICVGVVVMLSPPFILVIFKLVYNVN